MLLPKQRRLILLFCKAINERRLVKLNYESNSGNRDRTVLLYLVGVNKKGNIEVAGVLIEELSKFILKRYSGHYLIKEIDIEKVDILNETFKDPGVERKRVVDTPTVKIICRFIYNDESEEVVRAGWIELEDI
jgi:hypothetical protein